MWVLMGKVSVLGQDTPNEQPDDRSTSKLRDAGSDKVRIQAADRAKAGERDMGSALRSVYQKTVDESIPADLLDLLGKLD